MSEADDELYRLATGQAPDPEPLPQRDPELPLSDDEVRSLVTLHAGVQAGRQLRMRLQPDGPHPGTDKVFPMVVECPDGRFLAVLFSFGRPDADELLNWKPVWHSVEGPMSRDELVALGRSLK